MMGREKPLNRRVDTWAINTLALTFFAVLTYFLGDPLFAATCLGLGAVSFVVSAVLIAKRRRVRTELLYAAAQRAIAESKQSGLAPSTDDVFLAFIEQAELQGVGLSNKRGDDLALYRGELFAGQLRRATAELAHPTDVAIASTPTSTTDDPPAANRRQEQPSQDAVPQTTDYRAQSVHSREHPVTSDVAQEPPCAPPRLERLKIRKEVPFGSYMLERRLHHTPNTEIWEARLDQKRVIIRRLLDADDQAVMEFMDSAKIGVMLDHPNICRTESLNQISNSYFIEREHVEGKDLSSILETCIERRIVIPVSIATYIADKCCDALSHAHNRADAGGPLGIVHRAICPAHILVDLRGNVKVVDWDCAKARVRRCPLNRGRHRQRRLGYLSPEELVLAPTDRRTDLFSLGVCLNEMLVAQRLFSDSLESNRNRSLVAPSTHRPEISPQLDSIVLRSLAKDMDQRYQTAEELGSDLARLAGSAEDVSRFVAGITRLKFESAG